MSAHLACGTHRLDLSRPRVMGILNVTPDSFADGGRNFDFDLALTHARRMLADGADIIDVGGESTRPGAKAVSERTEIERVIPVIAALAAENVLVSVDTMKPGVMRAAIAAGASMINDVRALQARGALEAVAGSRCAVCLMHMQGKPRTMQADPHYLDVVREIRDFLVERALIAEGAGIARDRIAIDPGFGFGKTQAHNLVLLRSLRLFAQTGYPVLAGLSRKATIGEITGRSVEDRMAGSVAAALMAVAHGAAIVRVHDVRETADALKVWLAVENSDKPRK
jgi:dihydropteroate synthase